MARLHFKTVGPFEPYIRMQQSESATLSSIFCLGVDLVPEIFPGSATMKNTGPTQKLALHWFPQQKANGIFEWDFGLLPKINSVMNSSLLHLRVLFSMVIFTDKHQVFGF